MDLRNPDGVVLVETVGGSRTPPAVHPAGRVCGAPRCHTILSIYNGSNRCSLHTPLVVYGATYRVHRTAGSRRPAHARRTAGSRLVAASGGAQR